MNDDELQVLGYEAKQKRHRKWLLAIVVFLAVLAAVVIGGLIVRYAIKGAMDFDEELMRNDGLRPSDDTTIIPALQDAADSLLNAQMTEIGNCLQGQVIVMEVKTGEILAMVGLERNYEGKFQPCNNLAYQQELGSLMKTASLLALLETGKAKLSDEVDTGSGVCAVDSDLFMMDHNWRRGGYGTITLDRALEVSSDIGISKTVAKVFGNKQQEFFDQLDKMSFGKPDSINGIEGLKPSSYSSPKSSDWANWKIWWSSVGYERKMAPIQMLTFYNAIANGGKMVKPTLKTGEIEIINPQIASKANIDSMQMVLERVVSQGVGRKAGSPHLLVAGKTGRAEVGEYDFGRENVVDEYHLAFCGYFPAYAPKYSMIVSINKLGLPASGGGIAGVVFHNIEEWMLYHDMLSLQVNN